MLRHDQRHSPKDEVRWLIVEAYDGKFYGSGGSRKATGEWVGYRSLVEDNISPDAALVAAEAWAIKHDVPTVWVQLSPQDRSPTSFCHLALIFAALKVAGLGRSAKSAVPDTTTKTSHEVPTIADFSSRLVPLSVLAESRRPSLETALRQ